jgi:hypothetical protein
LIYTSERPAQIILSGGVGETVTNPSLERAGKKIEILRPIDPF